jgi:hypothetical protein
VQAHIYIHTYRDKKACSMAVGRKEGGEGGREEGGREGGTEGGQGRLTFGCRGFETQVETWDHHDGGRVARVHPGVVVVRDGGVAAGGGHGKLFWFGSVCICIIMWVVMYVSVSSGSLFIYDEAAGALLAFRRRRRPRQQQQQEEGVVTIRLLYDYVCALF